jgi:hypothetical protein
MTGVLGRLLLLASAWFMTAYWLSARELRSIVEGDFQMDTLRGAGPLSTYVLNIFFAPFFAIIFCCFARLKAPSVNILVVLLLILGVFLGIFWIQSFLTWVVPEHIYTRTLEGSIVKAALSVYAKCCAGCPVHDLVQYSRRVVRTCNSLGDNFYKDNQGWTHRHCNATVQLELFPEYIACDIPGTLLSFLKDGNFCRDLLS